MERNDVGNELGGTAGQPDANEFSGSGSTPQQDKSFDFAGSAGTTEQGQGIRDRAKNVIGNAGERLADAGSTVRERAGSVKDKLANALESGAGRLRGQQTGGDTLAAATPAGSTSVQGDGRAAQVSDRLAGGMQATADWLRDADVDSLRTGVERQVKEHPGRTLLIAAGLGYLIGRAFRNNQ